MVVSLDLRVIKTTRIRFIIFSVLIVVCFAGINDYNVYHNAPNSGKNCNSIQGAVSQAIPDGYTCPFGKRVRVVIHVKYTDIYMSLDIFC